MEKIKLNNEQVFELIPMGIITNKSSETRTFSFISNLGYSDIESAFSEVNISKVEYFSAFDELLKTYTDCLYLRALSKEFNKQIEDSVFADVYTVILAIA